MLNLLAQQVPPSAWRIFSGPERIGKTKPLTSCFSIWKGTDQIRAEIHCKGRAS